MYKGFKIIMFKFDEYPEIKKAHETSEKFDALTYKKEFAYEKSDKNENRKNGLPQ